MKHNNKRKMMNRKRIYTIPPSPKVATSGKFQPFPIYAGRTIPKIGDNPVCVISCPVCIPDKEGKLQ